MATALITGASGGIGYAFAECFAKQGASLVLVARNPVSLAAAKTKLQQQYGVSVQTISLDLTTEGAVERLFSLTQRQGLFISHLVNNAGFGDWCDFLDADWQRQSNMMRLNMLALTELCYRFGNEMRRRGFGRILNVASAAAFCPGPYMAVYYASKSYVLSFSQALAEEWAGSKVRVTVLCPCTTATGFERAANMPHSHMFSLIPPTTPEAVAAYGMAAMMRGQTVAYHTFATKAIRVSTKLFPTRLGTLAARWVNGKPSRKQSGKAKGASK